MAKDLCKFIRGSVWWVTGIDDAVGHEQKKDRPWLVVSNQLFNNTSDMVTMVPIHTGRPKSPVHVEFRNDQNAPNVILCEHFRTLDYSAPKYTFRYMYSLSDDLMDMVDRAISIQLGLHYSPKQVKELEDSISRLVDTAIHLKSKLITPSDLHNKVVSNVITKINTKIDDLISSTEGVELISPDQLTAKEYAETTLTVAAPEEKNPKAVSTEKPKRKRWTPEKAEEYLKDCENMPMKEVMTKWAIQKKQNYYSTKSYCEGILEKATRPTTDK